MVFTSTSNHMYSRRFLRGWLRGLLLIGMCLLAGCGLGNATTPTLRGQIQIDGSTALQPLVQAAAQTFMQLHPQVQITVAGGGSVTGLTDINAGKVDIGDSDIYASSAYFPNPALTDHLVCVIPFTMIVNPDVINVTSLTTDQIIKIFSTREYTNWQQVGGPNLPIYRVVRPATSGTRATFRKYILGGLDENEQSAQLLKKDSSTAVRDFVGATPGAIGYVGLSVLSATANVRPIAIGGVAATPATIEAGQYAFWGYEHMYTLGDDNSVIAAFLDYMYTDQIQQTALSLQYIPIAAMQLPVTASTPAASAWLPSASPKEAR